ncbi:MAG: response regulator [Lachnospiraceae bacterium]|nr:response regulator [Lachnospiraceae bacterium]
MNIIICDDNEILLQKEESVCKRYLESADVLLSYQESTQLYEKLLSERPEVDLFILDVEMPEVSGLDLKDLIAKLYEDTNIVFVTSHTGYMKEAFGKKVVGFLSRWEYEEKIGRFIDKIRNEKKQDRYIEIVDGRKTIQLSQRRILGISAQRVYTRVHYVEYYNADSNEIRLVDGVYRYSMQKWEECLDMNEFYKLNRSQIISFRYVQCITDEIEMVNGDIFRIPAGKKKVLREKYFNYICKRSFFE